MAGTAQQIQQFNQRNQQAGNPPTAPTTPVPTTPAPTTPAPTTPAPSRGANLSRPAPAPVRLNSRMSASDIMLLQKDTATLTKEEAIRRKALETKEALRQREEQENELRKQQEDEARRQGRYDRLVGSQVARGLQALDRGTASQRSWIMRAPTVGGIGVLLAIIILFLLAVVPVDSQGNTRLFLIWLTLTGKASLKTPPGSSISPNVDTTQTETQSSGNVVDSSGNNTPPDITFTMPSIFQNGNINLLDSLFN